MSVVDATADLELRWPALRRAWRQHAALPVSDRPLERMEIARLAPAIQRLSTRLTRDRDRVDEPYLDDPDLLGAYLLFYWPVSYAQARSIFAELAPRPLGRVLDLGAGPLPMSAAASDAGASEILALERVERARTLGQALVASPKQLLVRTWEASQPLPEGPFDTIVAGHLLNELFLGDRDPLARRADLLQGALRRLTLGGRLIVIEPALRDTSRALLALRDRAIGAGAVVLAPCLMQAACPALERASDWCHAERAWAPPAELAALAEAASIHKDRLKLSYLVLAAPGPSPRFPDDHFRIVSEPLDEKGKRVRVGCGPRGRHRLVLRERDLAAHNRVFDELERGDVVRIGAVEQKGDGLRLDARDDVTRLARAGAAVPEPEAP